MTITVLAAGALATAVAAIVVAQVMQRRRVRRQAEDCRIRAFPLDFLHERSTRLAAELVRHTRALARWIHRFDKARAELRTMPPPIWTGVRRVLRIVCVLLLPMLAAASAILNVEVFVALNGGIVTPAAVLKGVGASVVELGLTLYVAEQIEHRRPRDLDWQVRVAACLVLLVVVIGYVAAYAPARSQQALQQTISLDQRMLTAAQSADANAPSTATKLAITDAQTRLTSDVARLRRAERSDAGQSIAFPISEVLIGELALGGWIAVLDLARRRRCRWAMDRAARKQHHARRRIEQITKNRRAQAEARARAADVPDLRELMYGGSDNTASAHGVSDIRDRGPVDVVGSVTAVGQRLPEGSAGSLRLVLPPGESEPPDRTPAAPDTEPEIREIESSPQTPPDAALPSDPRGV